MFIQLRTRSAIGAWFIISTIQCVCFNIRNIREQISPFIQMISPPKTRVLIGFIKHKCNTHFIRMSSPHNGYFISITMLQINELVTFCYKMKFILPCITYINASYGNVVTLFNSTIKMYVTDIIYWITFGNQCPFR